VVVSKLVVFTVWCMYMVTEPSENNMTQHNLDW
jgi:hypothetical protein